MAKEELRVDENGEALFNFQTSPGMVTQMVGFQHDILRTAGAMKIGSEIRAEVEGDTVVSSRRKQGELVRW